MLLEAQDRSRWDLSEIEQANALLTAAMTPSPVIALNHAVAVAACD